MFMSRKAYQVRTLSHNLRLQSWDHGQDGTALSRGEEGSTISDS